MEDDEWQVRMDDMLFHLMMIISNGTVGMIVVKSSGGGREQ